MSKEQQEFIPPTGPPPSYEQYANSSNPAAAANDSTRGIIPEPSLHNSESHHSSHSHGHDKKHHGHHRRDSSSSSSSSDSSDSECENAKKHHSSSTANQDRSLGPGQGGYAQQDPAYPAGADYAPGMVPAPGAGIGFVAGGGGCNCRKCLKQARKYERRARKHERHALRHGHAVGGPVGGAYPPGPNYGFGAGQAGPDGALPTTRGIGERHNGRPKGPVGLAFSAVGGILHAPGRLASAAGNAADVRRQR